MIEIQLFVYIFSYLFRRRCGDSIDILLEDIKGFEPAQKHRRMDATTTTTNTTTITNSTTNTDAYDALLLEENVKNATRLQYRLNKGIPID